MGFSQLARYTCFLAQEDNSASDPRGGNIAQAETDSVFVVHFNASGYESFIVFLKIQKIPPKLHASCDLGLLRGQQESVVI